MKQSELDRAVAHATGETVSIVKQLGFLLADPIDSNDLEADEPGPHVIDWDELEAQRFQECTRSSQHELAIA